MFLLLTIAIPVLTLRSNDLCGMSIHQTDSPELPGFQSIEVGWTVPQLFIRPSESGTRSPLVAQEIALCCGDDCSSRLSAGILTKMGSTGKGSTSDLVLQFSPHHNPIQIDLPLGVEITSLDIIQIRLDKLSATRAHVKYTKYMNPNVNLTIALDIDVSHPGTQTRINGTINVTDSLSANVQHGFPRNPPHDDEENHTNQKNETAPQICGDSVWWVVSDAYEPHLHPFHLHNTVPERGPFPGFTPVLMRDYYLVSEEYGGKVPDQPPPTRLWDMVRDLGEGGGVEEVCKVARGMLKDSGVYLMYAPHVWDGI